MSKAEPVTSDIATGREGPREIFERRIFARSPFDIAGTTAVIFFVLFGSFIVAGLALHYPLWQVAHGKLAISDAVWTAFVLSFLAAAIFGLQATARSLNERDVPALGKILSGGVTSARRMLADRPTDEALFRAGAIGALLALALFVANLALSTRGQNVSPLALWFLCISVLLSALFVRGVLMGTRGARNSSATIDAELKIDLLRANELSIIGRRGARNALIWFTVAAIACLLFTDASAAASILFITSVCALMGVWIFVRPMERAHRRIKAAKAIELDRIRHEIASAREHAGADTGAAARLPGLLAYEHRIASVSEWPYDQSTLMRVGAYVLIPAIPWFGQAVASYFVTALTH